MIQFKTQRQVSDADIHHELQHLKDDINFPINTFMKCTIQKMSDGRFMVYNSVAKIKGTFYQVHTEESLQESFHEEPYEVYDDTPLAVNYVI